MKEATFDLEANGFLEDATQLWCGVIIDHETEEVYEYSPLHPDPEWQSRLLEHLASFDKLYGHGCIDYDFPLLRKLFGWEYEGEVFDTLLAARTQRPNRQVIGGCPKGVGPNSVQALAYRIGAERKVENEDWSRFTPHMLKRCVSDVKLQFKIRQFLEKEAEGEGWDMCHRLNMKLFRLLQRQEESGWLVDQEHMHRCIKMLEHWMERIRKVSLLSFPIVYDIKETKGPDGAYKYVAKPFKMDGTYTQAMVKYWECDNPSQVVGPFCRVEFRPLSIDSPVEVKGFLLEQGWEPDEWNKNNEGKKTSPKLSIHDSFSGIRGSLGKLLAKYIQCKHRHSAIKGLFDAIRDDGRIPAKVGGVATTGRLRHSVIVNIPGEDAFFGKWMRKIFIASPGWKMVGVDSKGNQMRQLAARMGDDEFTTAVLTGNKEDGTDEHSLNMRKIGAPNRKVAKNFFYGFIFGAQDRKVAAILLCPLEKAKQVRRDYLKSMPGLANLIETKTAEWRASAQKWFNKKWNRMEFRNGYIKGLDGRPILVDSEHKVLVFLLQSDEAIQMAAAYVWFCHQMERRGWKYNQDYRTLIWYHDEYQVECRPEIAEEVKGLMEESIAWAGRFYKIPVPHEGEGKIGLNWMETH